MFLFHYYGLRYQVSIITIIIITRIITTIIFILILIIVQNA